MLLREGTFALNVTRVPDMSTYKNLQDFGLCITTIDNDIKECYNLSYKSPVFPKLLTEEEKHWSHISDDQLSCSSLKRSERSA